MPPLQLELISKLSVEQTRYKKKTSNLTAMISELKSSLVEKDSELISTTVELVSRKDAYLHFEGKNADIFPKELATTRELYA